MVIAQRTKIVQRWMSYTNPSTKVVKPIPGPVIEKGVGVVSEKVKAGIVDHDGRVSLSGHQNRILREIFQQQVEAMTTDGGGL